MQAVISALQARYYPAWDWKQHIAILATHAYPDGEPPENFTSIISTYGVSVWNTEAGVWDRGFYEGPESSFTAWGKSLWPYEDGSRYYQGMLGAPNLLVQNFLRTLASGLTKYFYYDARTYTTPSFLLSHTSTIEYDGTVRAKGIAYAIAGSLLDHSTTLGNGSSDPGSLFLVFDKTGGPVAALFSSDKKPRQVTLGLSTSQFQVLDLMGNPITVAGATIPYGRLPVYVRGVGITGAQLKSALQSGAIATRVDTIAPNVSISDGPRGTVTSNAFRVRWIGVDDTSFPTNGEVNLEANAQNEPPNPQALVYSYRLRGSPTWSPWLAATFADFSNTPNGTYTFSVKVRDEANNESTVVSRTIVVNVPPTPFPQLTIAKSHVGNFTQSQIGATYTVTVSNTGTAPTTATVSVTDTAPTGLTITAMSGTGWTCAAATCTRTDALQGGNSYPAITVTVDVASNAPSSVTNSATVSGGGSTSNTANDVTTVNPPPKPDLTITKTHSGTFRPGQVGAIYTLTARNAGSAPTSGQVTVTDTLPSGLTATTFAGTGWTCTVSPLSCQRSDVLAAGASYPSITLTVNVASNAPASVTNTATVSGGGETNTANNTASDVTSIKKNGP